MYVALSATLNPMKEALRSSRVFKTAWFSRAARKALITDAELRRAITQVMIGQADALGGGVFKKRLDKNRYRAVIIAGSGRGWIYEYLFAKKDKANIDGGELAAFRSLVKIYSGLTEAQIARLLADGDILEIEP